MEQNNEVNPQELRNMEVLQQQDPGEHGQQEVGDVQQPPRPPPTPCPRCDSPETKFCYFNNHKADQPRFYCKTCRRYWTRGGTLRNIPIGGTSRKLKKSSKRASPCVNPVTMPCSAEDTIVSSPESPLKTEELGNISTSPVPVIAHGGATQIPRFSSRSSAHDTQKRHRLNNIMSSDFTISGGSINLPPSRLKQYHQLQWYQQQQQLAHISVSGSLSSVREIQKLNHFANLRGSDFIHSGILNFPPSGLQHHHQVQRHQRAQPLQQQEHFSGSGLLSSVAEIQKPTHLSDMINSDFILSSGLNPPPSNMQDQLQQPQHQKQSQQHPAPSHNPSCGLLSSVPEIQHLNNLDNMIGYAFTLSGGPSLPPSGMQHHYHKQRWHQQYQDQNQRQPTHNTHSGSLSFVPEVQKLNNLSGGLNLPPFAVRNDNSNVVSQWLPVEQSQY